MLTFAGTTWLMAEVRDSALCVELPALFREARDGEATTSLDPNWDPSGQWDNGLMALLPEVDVFLPNEVEALSMARISVVEDAIVRLRSSGAGTVVVKTAGQGAVAAQAGGVVGVAGIPTQVVDSTGAGDSFDAGASSRASSAGSRCGDAWRSGTRAVRCPRAASAARPRSPLWSRRSRRSNGAPCRDRPAVWRIRRSTSSSRSTGSSPAPSIVPSGSSSGRAARG